MFFNIVKKLASSFFCKWQQQKWKSLSIIIATEMSVLRSFRWQNVMRFSKWMSFVQKIQRKHCMRTRHLTYHCNKEFTSLYLSTRSIVSTSLGLKMKFSSTIHLRFSLMLDQKVQSIANYLSYWWAMSQSQYSQNQHFQHYMNNIKIYCLRQCVPNFWASDPIYTLQNK